MANCYACPDLLRITKKLKDANTSFGIYRLLDFWQRELRLQDWDIVVKLKPLSEMPDCRGETKYQLLKKQAIICLLDPNEGDGNTDFPYDAEITLVHELLHLHFVDGSQTPEECPVVFEQGITAVSESLVKLKRARIQ